MLTLTFFQLLSGSVFGMLISTFAEPLPAMAAFASTSFLGPDLARTAATALRCFVGGRFRSRSGLGARSACRG